MALKKILGAASLLTVMMVQPAFAKNDQVHKITFSSYLPPSYAYIWEPMNKFFENIEARTEGKVKFDVFHSAQLFEGYEEMPALTRQDVDMVNMTSTYPSGTVKALGLFGMPLVFDDVEHVERVLEAGIFDLGIRQEMEEKHNAVLLGYSPWDPDQIFSKKDSVVTVDDFKNKVWASTAAQDAEAIKALGGSPTTLPSSELYLAFDRGVIEATPRPMLTGIGRKLYEVMDHISVPTFGVEVAVLAINKDKWDELPTEYQEIIKEEAQEKDRFQYELVKKFISESIETFESKGVTVSQVKEEDLQEMRKIVRPIIENWTRSIDNGVDYLKLVDELRN